MRVSVESIPGSTTKPNEDAAAANERCVVVADGATARTETGCIHGVAWFTDQLVEAVLEHSDEAPAEALKSAIRQTADLHKDTCDLTDIATPGAAVVIVAERDEVIQFLVLGDVTLLTEGPDGLSIHVDHRVSMTASSERAVADALPQGSPEKATALVAMKHAELAARNVPGGFWAASTDPAAVDHAMTWEVPRGSVYRAAILTDGAARVVDPFKLMEWPELLDLLGHEGPAGVLTRVRAAEQSDPAGRHWIRNKTSDDATAAYVDFS